MHLYSGAGEEYPYEKINMATFMKLGEKVTGMIFE